MPIHGGDQDPVRWPAQGRRTWPRRVAATGNLRATRPTPGGGRWRHGSRSSTTARRETFTSSRRRLRKARGRRAPRSGSAACRNWRRRRRSSGTRSGHATATRRPRPSRIATLDDLEWAHGYAFGTPTRSGNPAAQLKQYLDLAGGLWFAGALADKAVTTFTSAMYPDGGLESTILALNNVFYHWGCGAVPPGLHRAPRSSR